MNYYTKLNKKLLQRLNYETSATWATNEPPLVLKIKPNYYISFNLRDDGYLGYARKEFYSLRDDTLEITNDRFIEYVKSVDK